jgi:hypothetical protein
VRQKGFAAILILAFVAVLVTGYFGIRYFQSTSKTSPGSNSATKKAEVSFLPKNFQECKTIVAQQGVSAKSICRFFVSENNALYQKCISYGGVRTEVIPVLCPGCESTPAGCNLTFIDPALSLPTNYNECCKAGFNCSGYETGENKEKRYSCTSQFQRNGVFDKVIGEKLYNDCMRKGGKVLDDGTFGDECQLEFFSESPYSN